MKKLLLLLILSACTSNRIQGDPKPNIIFPQDIDFCRAGCEHLASLPGQDGKNGCLEGRPLEYPDGGRQTCEEFCTMTEKNGRALDPKCWTTLLSCDEIEACRKDN